MKSVRVLSEAGAMARTVVHQLQTSRRVWIAVAWATENTVFTELLRQEEKLQRVVIGTHGSLTAPGCIEQLANKNWAFFRSAKGPLFHPKLYLFEHDDRYTAIIGSHNMTRGAFNSNVELSTASDFDKGDPAIRILQEFIAQEAKGPCIVPTDTFISRYRASHRAALSQRKNVDDLYMDEPVRIDEKHRREAPIHMEWEQWLKKVDEEDEHGRGRRLAMLERVQELMRQPGGFLKLLLKDRQRIAGISMERSKGGSDIDWHFFGEMTAARRFGHSYARLVEEAPEELVAALDFIPSDIPPNRENWLAYWKALLAAAGEKGGISIGGATRLACLKRPDYFVPVTSANREKLARQLGVQKNALDSPEDYWDTVVKTILLTPWWNEECPADPTDAKAWRARAAMLDAIVYVRPTKQ